jgi:hypothetical protein
MIDSIMNAAFNALNARASPNPSLGRRAKLHLNRPATCSLEANCIYKWLKVTKQSAEIRREPSCLFAAQSVLACELQPVGADVGHLKRDDLTMLGVYGDLDVVAHNTGASAAPRP